MHFSEYILYINKNFERVISVIKYLELGYLGKYFKINNTYLRKSHSRQSKNTFFFKNKFLISLVLPCFPTSYHKGQPDEPIIIRENDRVNEAHKMSSVCSCSHLDRGSKAR